MADSQIASEFGSYVIYTFNSTSYKIQHSIIVSYNYINTNNIQYLFFQIPLNQIIPLINIVTFNQNVINFISTYYVGTFISFEFTTNLTRILFVDSTKTLQGLEWNPSNINLVVPLNYNKAPIQNAFTFSPRNLVPYLDMSNGLYNNLGQFLYKFNQPVRFTNSLIRILDKLFVPYYQATSLDQVKVFNSWCISNSLNGQIPTFLQYDTKEFTIYTQKI